MMLQHDDPVLFQKIYKALKSKMFVNLGSQSLGYSLYQIIITLSNFVSGTEFQCMIYILKNKIFNLLQFWRLKLTRNTAMPDMRQKYWNEMY
jgi:hypothetical protein